MHCQGISPWLYAGCLAICYSSADDGAYHPMTAKGHPAIISIVQDNLSQPLQMIQILIVWKRFPKTTQNVEMAQACSIAMFNNRIGMPLVHVWCHAWKTHPAASLGEMWIMLMYIAFGCFLQRGMKQPYLHSYYARLMLFTKPCSFQHGSTINTCCMVLGTYSIPCVCTFDELYTGRPWYLRT